jgi:hypothetical protein
MGNKFSFNRESSPYIKSNNFEFDIVRVKDIILSDTHPEFSNYGGWTSLGTIFYDSVLNPTISPNINTFLVAKPLFPNIKHYPLKEEIVLLLKSAGTSITSNTSDVIKYYLPPTNIWNTPHQNAAPNQAPVQQSQNRNPEEISAGFPNVTTDSEVEINLGNTFKEKDIYSLLPYEGDVIYEGRWGNSLRLSSTVSGSNNGWSSVGNNGDPIIILRNGQTEYGEISPSFIPKNENINTDLSSIYLTSTQRLNIEPVVALKSSFAKIQEPTSVNEYNKNQIVLTSGRLVLNSRTDSILLRAQNSIHIASNTSINMDGSKQIVLDAEKVYLGSAVGSEKVNIQSVVLGEELVSELQLLTSALKSVAIGLQRAKDSQGGSIASLPGPGSILEATCNDLEKLLQGGSFLSKKVKTV